MPLIKLMLFIRDLLNHDENLIKEGQANEVMVNSVENYITVSSAAPAQTRSKSKSFDTVKEELTVYTAYSMTVAVDFYGTDAYTIASKMQLLIKTDKAKVLQRTHGLGLGTVSSVADIKQLTGQQYINRYQLTLVMYYNESLTIDVKRIDTAEIEINTEKGRVQNG